jgi:hypothetical protein
VVNLVIFGNSFFDDEERVVTSDKLREGLNALSRHLTRLSAVGSELFFGGS